MFCVGLLVLVRVRTVGLLAQAGTVVAVHVVAPAAEFGSEPPTVFFGCASSWSPTTAVLCASPCVSVPVHACCTWVCAVLDLAGEIAFAFM